MAKKIQCPFCEDCYISLASLQEHIEEEHLDDIPEDFTVNQYLYYIKTGKSGAKCVMCKRPTQWNESTNKYNRLCGRKECSDKYREMFKQRMIGKYGKTTLLNDPNQQRKMLEHRKISGKYKWSDKTEKTYTGTYELDFLKMLDLFMNWDSFDIMCPSPHTYYYEYDGEKKFYIPDMYIPSLNLEIEIKESDNHHPHMQVDRKKESLKDSVMKSQRNIDYIKIVDKSYDGFFKYLSKRKEEFLSNSSKDVKDISTKLTEALDSFDRLMEIEVDPIIESVVIDTDIKQSLETLKHMIYDDTDSVAENINIITNPHITENTNFSLEGLHDLIYNSSSEPLTETGKVITEQDSYFDYDKFVNGDSNILLITGLSGSGKSTLGKSLAEKYKAELISLDDVNIPYIIDLMNKNRITGWHSILKSYLLTKQKELLMKDDNGKYRLRYKLDVVDIVDVINDFFVYLLNRLSKTKKYIIEGIHIYEVLDFESVKDFPIIIKRTSSLTSMKQMLNREYNSFVELIKYELIQYKLDILQWYHKNLKALNAFTNRLVEFKTATDNSNEYTKKVYPVYVLLMHSGTALSTAIQKITHDEFSHSSISFDSSLNSMFSFGRKFANNPVSAGFTRENVDDAFFKRPIPYALYAVFVTKDEFAKMKKNLYNFVKHKDDLGYNFQGLIKYVLGVKPETRNKYFCSEFVSTILNTTTMRTNDRAAMTKPMDLAEMSDCHLIQKGLLTDYDKNVTDREVNKLLRLKNCTVKESIVVETKLSTKERNKLDVEEFGLPEERKFPLNDELRVRKAIQFFNYCSKEKRAELGKNIEKAMAKFDMKVSIGENNPAYNYISKKYIIE